MTERNMQLEDWLDDLCVRFIMNVPQADLSSVERICFQVEEAQWFYEDFIRPLDPTLPSMSLRTFCERIFAHCPLLSPFSQGSRMQAFEEFLLYKKRIPVRGAIMLNDAMDSAVLVKGWKKGANWSFPRGKINLKEDDLTCAIREVYEETGYDLAGLLPEDEEVTFIDVNMREQQLRLYVFKGVPMNTHFEPRTRKEISKIQWWKLSSLPAFRKKNQHDEPQVGTNSNKFYMVAPFLVKLRKWIIEEKKKDARRVSSNQYHSRVTSREEFFTEEDQGAESNGPGLYATEPESMPDIDTMAGGTATLNRLLHPQPGDDLIFPPSAPSPPGYSSPPAPTPPSGPPVAKNSGSALLALLHSKPTAPSQPLPKKAAPRTPLDQKVEQSTMPRSPHGNHRPRPSDFSNQAPPPNFPILPQNQAFSYQQAPQYPQAPQYQQVPQHQQRLQYQQPPSQQNPLQNRYPNAIQHPHPHSNQPPHLVHPQPLPPHVQRAVFNGGPVHAPMVPQPAQQHQPQFHSTVSVTLPNPQFPGLHSAMVPEAPKQSPPKLTSHSLALLNAFKNRDQASGDPTATNDLPLRRYTQQPAPAAPAPRSQPQELPVDDSQSGEMYPEVSLLQSHQSLLQSHQTHIDMNEKLLAAKQAISERQKSTLLDLFKSPTTADPPVPAKPLSATALPISATPSAVELSAVEPLSNTAVLTSALLNNKRAPGGRAHPRVPQMNPETNLPYRAHSILSRPSELSDQDAPIRDNQMHRPQARGSLSKPVANVSSQDSKSSTPEKPFRPQILKRPQPGSGRGPAMSPPAHVASPPRSQPAPQQRANQSVEQRQTLLSLFSKTVPEVAPLSRHSTGEGLPSMASMEPASSLSARSRVGSLASGDGNRRPNHSPISPADKGFLLGYLEAVAKGQR